MILSFESLCFGDAEEGAIWQKSPQSSPLSPPLPHPWPRPSSSLIILLHEFQRWVALLSALHTATRKIFSKTPLFKRVFWASASWYKPKAADPDLWILFFLLPSTLQHAGSSKDDLWGHTWVLSSHAWCPLRCLSNQKTSPNLRNTSRAFVVGVVGVLSITAYGPPAFLCLRTASPWRWRWSRSYTLGVALV